MHKLITQFLDLADIRIAYREHGSGAVLILLHGNSSNKSLFSKYQMVHFKDFRTIALDSRSHGQSESHDTHISIAQISDDVIRFCKARGIANAAVIGYSDGGNIALFLAKNAPKIFHKVVAISPNYLVSGTTENSLRFIERTEKTLRLLAHLGFPTRKALMRFELMLNDIGLTDQDLKKIQTSLRILYAEHDMIKEEHILEMGQLIPGVTVRRVEGCNHMTIFHKPETIADIRKYLLEA
ncbi:MAG: alpha/beta hydrolase [Anaerolineaceae bacterium]|nr:alpha/beta hydrolase [Anaerolineaceae bacterium]